MGLSRSSRACGLKPVYCEEVLPGDHVTLFTSVWIETYESGIDQSDEESHALHERVD